MNRRRTPKLTCQPPNSRWGNARSKSPRCLPSQGNTAQFPPSPRDCPLALSTLRPRPRRRGRRRRISLGREGRNREFACPRPHEDKTEQDQPKSNRRQADVKRPDGRLEAELDRVRARREEEAAHNVIAAQQRLWFAIHTHFPIRIEAVVQQQH